MPREVLTVLTKHANLGPASRGAGATLRASRSRWGRLAHVAPEHASLHKHKGKRLARMANNGGISSVEVDSCKDGRSTMDLSLQELAFSSYCTMSIARGTPPPHLTFVFLTYSSSSFRQRPRNTPLSLLHVIDDGKVNFDQEHGPRLPHTSNRSRR